MDWQFQEQARDYNLSSEEIETTFKQILENKEIKTNLLKTKAKLYQKFLDYIYDKNLEEISVSEEEKQDLNIGLGELAKVFLNAEKKCFQLTDPVVCEYLGKLGDHSLLDRALNWGILQEIQTDAASPVYGFYPMTFQDYFAALTVED